MQELVIFLLAVAVGGAIGAAILRFAGPLVLARFSAGPASPEPALAAEPTHFQPELVASFLPAQESTPQPADGPPAAQPAPPPEPVAEPTAPELVEPDAEPEADGRNRRRHVRLDTDEPIMVTPFAGSETMGEVCDVSLGGVRFRVVGLALRSGDMLRVTFNLGEESLSAVARVLRTRQLDDITSEVSAEFARLDPWAARRFEEALAEKP